jgi:NADH dehydrogenase
MQANRIVVFGGSGFVGRYVVDRLAETGARIVVPSRRPTQAEFLRSCGNVGQIALPAVDIRDPDSVKSIVKGADTVINLVGLLYEKGRRNFQSIHVDAAGRLAEIASEAGVSRFVQMSALGADRASRSNYARSKAMGEEAVRRGFPHATILRPSVIVGAEDAILNKFAVMARYSPALPLIGGGRTRFQPIFVGDVAKVIEAVLTRNDARGRTYLLGGPKVYSFRELMQMMLTEIGRRRLLVPVPFWYAAALGGALSLLPKPLLTRDQINLLRQDNVVPVAAEQVAAEEVADEQVAAKDGAPRDDRAEGHYGISDLNISPTAIEAVIGPYLARYRPVGTLARGSRAA